MLIKLSEKDNNTVVKATKEDKIELTLPVNKSTGYYWAATDTSAGKIEEVQHDGEHPKLPGSASNVRFIFDIQKTGSFTLNYARPWGELTPPDKWFNVDIVVS